MASLFHILKRKFNFLQTNSFARNFSSTSISQYESTTRLINQPITHKELKSDNILAKKTNWLQNKSFTSSTSGIKNTNQTTDLSASEAKKQKVEHCSSDDFQNEILLIKDKMPLLVAANDTIVKKSGTDDEAMVDITNDKFLEENVVDLTIDEVFDFTSDEVYDFSSDKVLDFTSDEVYDFTSDELYNFSSDKVLHFTSDETTESGSLNQVETNSFRSKSENNSEPLSPSELEVQAQVPDNPSSGHLSASSSQSTKPTKSGSSTGLSNLISEAKISSVPPKMSMKEVPSPLSTVSKCISNLISSLLEYRDSIQFYAPLISS